MDDREAARLYKLAAGIDRQSMTVLVLPRSIRPPKLLHPSPSAETMRPVLPNGRLIMASPK